jgi:O-antigen/teichoic acid export membrane protein
MCLFKNVKKYKASTNLNMRKKYIITFMAEFLVLVSGILVYKFAAHFLGNVGFSEYALSRRTIALMQPALLMGLGVAIPRYVAYSSGSTTRNPDFYFVSAVGMLFVVVIGTISLMYLFKRTIAFLIFGSSGYTYLILPLALMLVGIISHIMCYTYFQGKLLMAKANLLQVVNIAIVPLVVFLLAHNTAKILVFMGGLWLTISMVSFFYILRQLQIPSSKITILPYAKEIFIYGIQRVPGDFGLAALLSLIAVFTAHTAGVEQAGYVAFGISILSAAASLFAPIGLVLLPHASQMVANLEINKLRNYVKRIFAASMFLTLIGVIVFIIFADVLIKLYLGSSFLKLSSVAKVIAVGIIPYTVFVSMRSVLDSYYLKAVNAKNILISLGFFLVCGGLTLFLSISYKYIVIEFILSLFVLGALTLIDVKKIFKQNG